MKLSKKIATTLAGFALVLGSGIAAFSGAKNFIAANATTGTASINFKKADQVTTATEQQLVFTEGVVTVTADKANASTNANNYYPGVGQSTTRFYKNSIVTISAGSNYLTSISFTATGTNFAGALNDSEWTNGTPTIDDDNVVTIVPDLNVHEVSAVISGTCGFNSASIGWDSELSTSPYISVDTSSLRAPVNGSANLNVTYSNLTGALNITSSDTNVATVSYSPVSSGTGEVTVTVNGVTEGDATITLASSGATSVQVNVATYVPVTFVQIDSLARLTDGTNVIVAAKNQDYAMGKLASSNRTAIEVEKTTNTKDENILTIDPGVVSVFAINKSGDYYTFQNTANNKYIYASSSDKNELKENDNIDDNAKFAITYASGETNIEAQGTNTHNILRYNSSSKLFSCYTSGQQPVTLYMEGNELPSDISVTNISNISFADEEIEEGNKTTLTANYTPINATVTISITLSDLSDGDVTIDNIVMNNGTLTAEITGVSAGEVMLLLNDEFDSDVLTITPSTIIYNSGLLTGNSVSTEVGEAKDIAGLLWYNVAFVSDYDDAGMSTNATKGMQIGAAAKPVSKFAVQSQLFVGEDYNNDLATLMESITINASTANDGNCDMEVFLDDSSLGSVALTNTATDYVFDASDVMVGHIRIEFTNNAEKAFYLGSIVVKGYEDGDSSGLYQIAQELELLETCEMSASEWVNWKATNHESFDMSYDEVIEIMEDEFATITIYDHQQLDGSSLKQTEYSALYKYQVIEDLLANGSGTKLLRIVNNNYLLPIVIISSITALSAVGLFFILRKKKHQ